LQSRVCNITELDLNMTLGFAVITEDDFRTLIRMLVSDTNIF